jgi:hypothetical protein
MSQPLDQLNQQYYLLGRTIDSSLKRLGFKRAQPKEEALVLQAAYLFGVRAFESFLEGQIVYLCRSDATWGPKTISGKSKRYYRRITDDNPKRIKAIITIGRPYADFLPIEKTLEKARVLFAFGQPFTLLTSDQNDIIKRSQVVRNLIAHESEHSLRQFKRVVCARYPLRKDQQNATSYIVHEQQRGIPMIKQDIAGLLQIAQFLS